MRSQSVDRLPRLRCSAYVHTPRLSVVRTYLYTVLIRKHTRKVRLKSRGNCSDRGVGGDGEGRGVRVDICITRRVVHAGTDSAE